MGKLDGKVAFVTGAGRGQGRSHALRLASEGADIIAVDLCADVDTIVYPLATPDDLAETVAEVEKLDRRIVSSITDVRDLDAMKAAVDAGVAELGRLDIVVANAGICSSQTWDEVTPALWADTIDVNLTGVWHTCAASIPHLLEAGGGSMVLISSTAGLKGLPFLLPYAAAKHGVVGIMHVLANELASRSIRVNSVHPTGVDTPLLAGMAGMGAMIDADPSVRGIFDNSLPVGFVEPGDISAAVLFLASDDARYVTGLAMTVDAGTTAR